MSDLYRLASVADGSGDTTARAGIIVLPPLSTVSTQAARIRTEDVVCTLPALDIGGPVCLQGQAVALDGMRQVRWIRLSLCVGVCGCGCVCCH
jgi:hypothetical protein